VKQLSEPSSTIQQGLVTRTDPPAGSSVPVGSTVTVYVSSGAPQATVPNVVGYTQADANSALTAAGFQPNFVTTSVNKCSQNDVVQSQNPSGGSSAPQGSSVTVVVGQNPSCSPPTTTATVSPGQG
jgi:eukaryotic-like serine/threonine-protein kinase